MAAEAPQLLRLRDPELANAESGRWCRGGAGWQVVGEERGDKSVLTTDLLSAEFSESLLASVKAHEGTLETALGSSGLDLSLFGMVPLLEKLATVFGEMLTKKGGEGKTAGELLGLGEEQLYPLCAYVVAYGKAGKPERERIWRSEERR